MNTIIICVNYNSYDELKNYIHSVEVAAQKIDTGNSVTVIVADNSEKAQVCNYQGCIRVIYISTGGNLGYLGGVAYGINASGKDLSDYDFIVISNVDLIIPENFFLNLYNEKIGVNVGCIAPSIISKNGQVNRNPKVLSRYSANKLRMLKLMYKIPILWYVYNKFLHRGRRLKVENESTQERDIYAAHGSFMLFTNRFADYLQTMQYPTFMFCEELFFAENLKKLGLRTVYKPSLLVNDIDHVSTSKMKKKYYFKSNYESLNMILKEYYSE